MARGGRGGGRSNPANLPRPQQVSRKVSWLLRHGATQEGLTLGTGGYVNVADALNTRALQSLNITFSDLREAVLNNDKQRFSIVLASTLEEAPSSEIASTAGEKREDEVFDPSPPSDDPSHYLIRANQGHSIAVDTEGLLVPITEAADNIPDVVVHGTNVTAWKLILKGGGLRRMSRNHIHFASGLPQGFEPISAHTSSVQEKETTPVISGMRKNAAVLIYIDIKAALAAGIKFYVSENGVILTGGNEKGVLSYEFFSIVEHRKPGGGVLMTDGKLPDGVVVNVEEWQQEVGDETKHGSRGGRSSRGGRGDRSRGGKARIVDGSSHVMTGQE